MSGVSDALATLQAMAHGQAPSASTGPSAANALGANFVDGKVPMVYWGQQSAAVRPNTRGMTDSREQAISDLGIPSRPRDSTVTLQGAVEDWYKWSDQERGDFAKRLYKVGLISDPGDLYGQSGAFAQWQNAVQTASNFYTFANRKVTPWQAVDLMANTANGGQKSRTQTSQSFNIPTVEDAHAATKSLFQALMGRDPNGDELDRYASMMTAYAQKHPSVTTTTTDIHGNQTVTSRGGATGPSGGMSEGFKDALANQAKADPEYGSYQAATTYFNALLGAIGSTNHG